MVTLPQSHHVLMVVNTYAPDDSRVIFGATSLAKKGYNVHLVGSARNRNQDTIRTIQSVEDVTIQLLPHLTRLTQLSRTIVGLIKGSPPQSITTSSARTTLLSIVLFNLWILRIGLSQKIDIIHCHDLSPLFACWLLATIKRKPLIYDIHENVPTMYSGRKGSIMAQLERWLVPQVDYVISAGHRLKDAMVARGAQAVTHIGNWKRLSEYDIPPSEIKQLRHQYSISDEAIVVSFFGVLDKNRELTPLLEAICQSSDCYLMIAGRGEQRQLVIDYASQCTNIIWLDWLDLMDLPRYTLIADVLYYCRAETMPGGSYDLAPAPNKLYEAFAAGIPIIARRGIGEIGEILETSSAGILLEDVTAETVIQELQNLKNPVQKQHYATSLQKARQQYNWSKAENLLYEIYDTLLVK
ncbi:MAG: glycosyltransferase [Chloroflexota bacterium]